MDPSFNPYFRRRTIGRASSPPTFACYEQRENPYDDDDDYSDDGSEDNVSCSEDGEDYGRHESDSENEDHHHHVVNTQAEKQIVDHDDDDDDDDDDDEIDMEIDEGDDGAVAKKVAAYKKDVKGKQRAIEPEPESPKKQHHHRQKKPRQSVYTLRPILTIQRSQGFVWNQDLFVPPYIKDRYAVSTSPPNSLGFVSTSASSTNSALDNYEVEVVEIRVTEKDLDRIIP